MWTVRNSGPYPVMITLTYPGCFPTDGRAVKRHLAAFRKWLWRRGVHGVWFLEFQARGAPHFHILATQGVPGLEVSAAWYRIVGSGDERHLAAGTRVDVMHSAYAWVYAAKYSTKAEQKIVPAGFEDVGRFWGEFGQRTRGETYVVNRRVVRTMRRAYVAERRSWAPRGGRPWGRWRDRGRSGFRCYSCAGIARRLLDGHELGGPAGGSRASGYAPATSMGAGMSVGPAMLRHGP